MPRQRRLSGTMRRGDFALMVGPSVVVMVLLLGIPLIYTLLWSVQQVAYQGAGEFVGLQNFSRALNDPVFRSAVTFTVGFALVNTVLVIILGYGLALLLHRARRGRAVFLGFLLVPFVLPPVVAATAFSWLFDDNFGGLVNFVVNAVTGQQFLWFSSTWPNRILILAETLWTTVPFVMLVFLAALKTVPADTLEAATVDGASWWQRQRFVVIPALGAVTRFLVLISIMDGLRLFDALIPLAPSAESIGTSSVSLYVYRRAFARSQQDLGLGSAVNVLMMIAMLILIAPFIRQIYREVRAA